MPSDRQPSPMDCNLLALRQAARHVTQFYDRYLVPTGLRATQFGILAKLERQGPITINALAADLVMDRTTLGRNIRPLERDGLIAIETGAADRRSKEIRLTKKGEQRFRAALKGWGEAQTGFETAVGSERASDLRMLLRAVVETEFGPGEATRQ